MYLKFLPACLLLAVTAHAQPTLTNANNNFLAGTSFIQYTGSATSPGASGANVVWDFSAIGTSAGNSYSYTACSSSTNCGTFPGSNVVIAQPPTTGYFIVDNTRQAVNGAAVGSTNIIYSNPEDMLRFPFTYNNTYTDNFSANFTSGGSSFVRSGSVTVTADGYGKLILPNGTYNNILRVKRVETYTDTWSGPTINYSSEIYAWYSPAKRENLLSKSSITVAGNTTDYPITYTNQTPTAIGNLAIAEGSVNLYPNPARDLVHVRFEADKATTADVILTDLTGRMINTLPAVSIASGSNDIKMNTVGLSAGLYLVRLTADGQSITRKVEVL